MKEPPALKDRDGEPIVVFRRPDGSFFSNHPDYPMAQALWEQAGSPDDEVEEDETVEPDNGDGVIQYSEMQSKDLLAEAKQRGLVESGTKSNRSKLIEMLQAADAEKASK